LAANAIIATAVQTANCIPTPLQAAALGAIETPLSALPWPSDHGLPT
jgi:hypothetical protein